MSTTITSTPPQPPPPPPSSSYWCYRCNRFVRVSTFSYSSISCPDCHGGFLEAFESPPLPPPPPPPLLPPPPPFPSQISSSPLSDSPRRRFPTSAMYMVGNSNPNSNSNSSRDSLSSSPRLRRSRRNGGDRSPFNPVIVLRAPSEPEAGGVSGGGGGGGSFELYYDDGGGSGLRPLPASVSEFLLGSGFDRLLDQLAKIEINGIGRTEQPPASKAAIESMPTIDIGADHVESECYCAVCKEAFEVGSEAREMPCKHIYHHDCILPWLSLRNSCPVCRHELPSDARVDSEFNPGNGGSNVVSNVSVNNGNGQGGGVFEGNEDETVGLTIWRLPGGGFGVGWFSGGRRGERELPVVYTEMDGGFNQGGVPRRISWGARGGRSRESGGGFRRVLRSLFSCFGGGHSRIQMLEDSTSSSNDSRMNNNGQRSRASSFFSAASRSRSRGLDIRRW